MLMKSIIPICLVARTGLSVHEPADSQAQVSNEVKSYGHQGLENPCAEVTGRNPTKATRAPNTDCSVWVIQPNYTLGSGVWILIQASDD